MSTDWFFAYPWLVLPALFICYGLFVVLVGRWLSRRACYQYPPEFEGVGERERMVDALNQRRVR